MSQPPSNTPPPGQPHAAGPHGQYGPPQPPQFPQGPYNQAPQTFSFGPQPPSPSGGYQRPYDTPQVPYPTQQPINHNPGNPGNPGPGFQGWVKQHKVLVLIAVLASLAIIGALISPDDSETGTAAATVTVTPSQEAGAGRATSTTAAPATQQTTIAPQQTTQAQQEPVVQYSAEQQALLSTVYQARADYEAAQTDLQRAQVVKNRTAALLAGGTSASAWSGTIKTVGANGEGKAYVEIEFGDHVAVQTWNNAVSDIYDDTLIPDSSPIYDALLGLTPGDAVTFSGEFLRDFEATNVTEVFGIEDPQFLMKFTEIAAA